jgi:pyruvate/2-oxoglutarate dehydrogenase complex dihydrolipoamide acyltransferase (E2) component
MKASAATKGAQHVPYDPASPITAWDSLRERFAKRPFPGWSFRAWGASLKGPKDLALVRLALRELGATCEEKAAASTLVTTLMRVIFTPQEVRSMSAEATEVSTAAAAKKPTAKKAATKKPAEKDAPARSMSRSVGQALKDAGFASPLVSKLLKDEKVTKTQLTELRDAINTKASALRDADKGAAASKLSAANKLVRRLSRTK